MVPWLSPEALLERQQTYDVAKFRNEVLGLPVSLGEHVVTREQLEACCTDKPMAQSTRMCRTRSATSSLPELTGRRGSGSDGGSRGVYSAGRRV